MMNSQEKNFELNWKRVFRLLAFVLISMTLLIAWPIYFGKKVPGNSIDSYAPDPHLAPLVIDALADGRIIANGKDIRIDELRPLLFDAKKSNRAVTLYQATIPSPADAAAAPINQLIAEAGMIIQVRFSPAALTADPAANPQVTH